MKRSSGQAGLSSPALDTRKKPKKTPEEKKADARARQQKSRGKKAAAKQAEAMELSDLPDLLEEEVEDVDAPVPMAHNREVEDTLNTLGEGERFVHTLTGVKHTKLENVVKLDQLEGRGQYWHLVSYNPLPAEEFLRRATKVFEDTNSPFFAACGRHEVGDEKGTPHHQLFVYFSRPVCRSEAMAPLCEANEVVYYCKRMYNTANKDHGIKYCTDPKKPGLIPEAFNPWQVGNWELVPKSGKEKKGDLLVEGIRQGIFNSPVDVWACRDLGAYALQMGSRIEKAFEWHRAFAHRQKLESTGQLPPPTDPFAPRVAAKIIFIGGVPSAGKTVKGMQLLGAEFDPVTKTFSKTAHIYNVGADTRNKHNAYLDQEAMLINDHDGSVEFGMSIRTMMAIADTVPFSFDAHAGTAGSPGYRPCRVKTLVITSNKHIKEWEIFQKEHPTRQEAFMERIAEYHWLTKKFEGRPRQDTKFFLDGHEEKSMAAMEHNVAEYIREQEVRRPPPVLVDAGESLFTNQRAPQASGPAPLPKGAVKSRLAPAQPKAPAPPPLPKAPAPAAFPNGASSGVSRGDKPKPQRLAVPGQGSKLPTVVKPKSPVLPQPKRAIEVDLTSDTEDEDEAELERALLEFDPIARLTAKQTDRSKRVDEELSEEIDFAQRDRD